MNTSSSQLSCYSLHIPSLSHTQPCIWSRMKTQNWKTKDVQNTRVQMWVVFRRFNICNTFVIQPEFSQESCRVKYSFGCKNRHKTVQVLNFYLRNKIFMSVKNKNFIIYDLHWNYTKCRFRRTRQRKIKKKLKLSELYSLVTLQRNCNCTIPETQPRNPMFPENTVWLTVTWDIRGKFIFVTVHAMKAYGGVAVQSHEFLNSIIDGGEWSTSPPGRFTLAKEPSVPIE
jgi:hypothetical protein